MSGAVKEPVADPSQDRAPAEIKAFVDRYIFEQANRNAHFVARLGFAVTLLAGLAGGIDWAISGRSAIPWRLLVPLTLLCVTGFTWFKARNTRLTSGWMWVFAFVASSLPGAMMIGSLAWEPHGPAQFLVAPLAFLWLASIAVVGIFLDWRLCIAVAAWNAAQTGAVVYLALPIYRQLSGSEPVVEMLTSVGLHGTRLGITLAVGVVVAILCKTSTDLVTRVAREEHARRLALQGQVQAESASDAKSAFLASMSHELRTPLNAIIGYAQILRRRRSGDADTASALETIEESGRHLGSIIDDVLDMAKIEADKIELAETDVHLARAVESVAELFLAKSRAKGLGVRVAVDPSIPGWVRVDVTRLRQVLTNLIGNAVKFTEEGRVTVQVAADPAGTLFEVSDTGPGIAVEDLVRIFEPFEQAGTGSKRQQGTGLGLSISRRLVRLMGGELMVDSELGRGTTFRFVLPLPPAAPGPEVSALHVSGYEGPRRSVLVADDSELNRVLLADLLEPLGFQVELARDGDDALARAASSSPDIVLMDLVMPGTDGFAAARQLRASGLPVPIIAVSASVLSLEAERDGALFDAVVRKPVDQGELLSAMGAALGLSWIGARPEHEPGAGASPAMSPENGAMGSTALPSDADLRRLLELTRMGDLLQVETECERLRNTECREFAERAQRMAAAFDDEGLLSFLSMPAAPQSDLPEGSV